MVTRSDVDAYQSVIDGLSTVAFAQVKSLLQSLDTQNPIEFRDALLVTYPELLSPFTQSASDVAAEWYMELRGNAGVTRSFAPVAAAVPALPQIEAGVRHSLSPLFRPQQFIGSDVLTLLAGVTQKFIANQGRDTVRESAFSDPVRVGYARIPRLGCCAFCGMMAARGAVYRSETAAGAVVGRGVDSSVTAGKRGGQGKGVKIRGEQKLGEKFHDYCRCVVAPRFVGGDNDYAEYTKEHFKGLYAETDGLKENKDGYVVTDLKATLASWRKEHGTR